MWPQLQDHPQLLQLLPQLAACFICHCEQFVQQSSQQVSPALPVLSWCDVNMRVNMSYESEHSWHMDLWNRKVTIEFVLMTRSVLLKLTSMNVRKIFNLIAFQTLHADITPRNSSTSCWAMKWTDSRRSDGFWVSVFSTICRPTYHLKDC